PLAVQPLVPGAAPRAGAPRFRDWAMPPQAQRAPVLVAALQPVVPPVPRVWRPWSPAGLPGATPVPAQEVPAPAQRQPVPPARRAEELQAPPPRQARLWRRRARR